MTDLDHQPAFLSDDLDLDEVDKACARYDYINFGPASSAELIECIHRNGRIDGIIECALLLPLRDYYRVKAVWENAIPPEPIKKRRKKH